jgi:hypothetical protein
MNAKSWKRAFVVRALANVALGKTALAETNVVQSGGYTLTVANLNNEITIFEAVLGKPISASDLPTFRTILVDDFRAHRAAFSKGLTSADRADSRSDLGELDR